MWNRILEKLLERYLSPYFENIERESFKFAILDGNLELKNLVLRRDISSLWNLPVTILRGTVSKLSIKLSWGQWVSKRFDLSLEVDGVKIMCKPIDDSKKTVEEIFQELRENKMSKVIYRERQMREELKDLGSEKNSLYFRILDGIARNCNVRLNDIHLVFYHPDESVIIGLTVDSLGVSADQHTEEEGRSAKPDSTRDDISKVSNLEKLNIYGALLSSRDNEDGDFYVDESLTSKHSERIKKDFGDLEEIKNMFSIKSNLTKFSDILSPLDVGLHFNHSWITREMHTELQLGNTKGINLGRTHIRKLLMQLQQISLKNRQYHVLLMRNSYLVDLTTEGLQKVTQVEFRELFYRQLQKKNGIVGCQELSPAEEERIQLLHDVVPTRQLALWRSMCHQSLDSLKESRKEREATDNSWFSWLRSSHEQPPDNAISFSEEERKFMQQALYSEAEEVAIPTKFNFYFLLENLDLHIFRDDEISNNPEFIDSPRSLFLSLSLNSLTASLSFRTCVDQMLRDALSWKFSLEMKSFDVTYGDKKSSILTFSRPDCEIIEESGKSEESATQWDLGYEVGLTSNTMIIKGNMLPLQLQISQHLTREILPFFHFDLPKPNFSLYGQSHEDGTTSDDSPERPEFLQGVMTTTDTLRKRAQEADLVDIDLTLSAPILKITTSECHCVQTELGRLTLKSSKQSTWKLMRMSVIVDRTSLSLTSRRPNNDTFGDPNYIVMPIPLNIDLMWDLDNSKIGIDCECDKLAIFLSKQSLSELLGIPKLFLEEYKHFTHLSESERISPVPDTKSYYAAESSSRFQSLYFKVKANLREFSINLSSDVHEDPFFAAQAGGFNMEGSTEDKRWTCNLARLKLESPSHRRLLLCTLHSPTLQARHFGSMMAGEVPVRLVTNTSTGDGFFSPETSPVHQNLRSSFLIETTQDLTFRINLDLSHGVSIDTETCPVELHWQKEPIVTIMTSLQSYKDVIFCAMDTESHVGFETSPATSSPASFPVSARSNESEGRTSKIRNILRMSRLFGERSGGVSTPTSDESHISESKNQDKKYHSSPYSQIKELARLSRGHWAFPDFLFDHNDPKFRLSNFKIHARGVDAYLWTSENYGRALFARVSLDSMELQRDYFESGDSVFSIVLGSADVTLKGQCVFSPTVSPKVSPPAPRDRRHSEDRDYSDPSNGPGIRLTRSLSLDSKDWHSPLSPNEGKLMSREPLINVSGRFYKPVLPNEPPCTCLKAELSSCCLVIDQIKFSSIYKFVRDGILDVFIEKSYVAAKNYASSANTETYYQVDMRKCTFVLPEKKNNVPQIIESETEFEWSKYEDFHKPKIGFNSSNFQNNISKENHQTSFGCRFIDTEELGGYFEFVLEQLYVANKRGSPSQEGSEECQDTIVLEVATGSLMAHSNGSRFIKMPVDGTIVENFCANFRLSFPSDRRVYVDVNAKPWNITLTSQQLTLIFDVVNENLGASSYLGKLVPVEVSETEDSNSPRSSSAHPQSFPDKNPLEISVRIANQCLTLLAGFGKDAPLAELTYREVTVGIDIALYTFYTQFELLLTCTDYLLKDMRLQSKNHGSTLAMPAEETTLVDVWNTTLQSKETALWIRSLFLDVESIKDRTSLIMSFGSTLEDSHFSWLFKSPRVNVYMNCLMDCFAWINAGYGFSTLRRFPRPLAKVLKKRKKRKSEESAMHAENANEKLDLVEDPLQNLTANSFIEGFGDAEDSYDQLTPMSMHSVSSTSDAEGVLKIEDLKFISCEDQTSPMEREHTIDFEDPHSENNLKDLEENNLEDPGEMQEVALGNKDFKVLFDLGNATLIFHTDFQNPKAPCINWSTMFKALIVVNNYGIFFEEIVAWNGKISRCLFVGTETRIFPLTSAFRIQAFGVYQTLHDKLIGPHISNNKLPLRSPVHIDNLILLSLKEAKEIVYLDQSRTVNEIAFKFTMGDTYLKLSSRDFALILAIASQLGKDSPRLCILPGKPPIVLYEAEVPLLPADTDQREASGSNITVPRGYEWTFPPFHNVTSLVLAFGNLQITILDDVGSSAVPILTSKIILDQIEYQSHAISRRCNVGSLEMDLHFINPTTRRFDPVIESLDLSVRYTDTHLVEESRVAGLLQKKDANVKLKIIPSSPRSNVKKIMNRAIGNFHIRVPAEDVIDNFRYSPQRVSRFKKFIPVPGGDVSCILTSSQPIWVNFTPQLGRLFVWFLPSFYEFITTPEKWTDTSTGPDCGSIGTTSSSFRFVNISGLSFTAFTLNKEFVLKSQSDLNTKSIVKNVKSLDLTSTPEGLDEFLDYNPENVRAKLESQASLTLSAGVPPIYIFPNPPIKILTALQREFPDLDPEDIRRDLSVTRCQKSTRKNILSLLEKKKDSIDADDDDLQLQDPIFGPFPQNLQSVVVRFDNNSSFPLHSPLQDMTEMYNKPKKYADSYILPSKLRSETNTSKSLMTPNLRRVGLDSRDFTQFSIEKQPASSYSTYDAKGMESAVPGPPGSICQIVAQVSSPHPSFKLITITSPIRIYNSTNLVLEISFLDYNGEPIPIDDPQIPRILGPSVLNPDLRAGPGKATQELEADLNRTCSHPMFIQDSISKISESPLLSGLVYSLVLPPGHMLSVPYNSLLSPGRTVFRFRPYSPDFPLATDCWSVPYDTKENCNYYRGCTVALKVDNSDRHPPNDMHFGIASARRIPKMPYEMPLYDITIYPAFTIYNTTLIPLEAVLYRLDHVNAENSVPSMYTLSTANNAAKLLRGIPYALGKWCSNLEPLSIYYCYGIPTISNRAGIFMHLKFLRSNGPWSEHISTVSSRTQRKFPDLYPGRKTITVESSIYAPVELEVLTDPVMLATQLPSLNHDQTACVISASRVFVDRTELGIEPLCEEKKFPVFSRVAYLGDSKDVRMKLLANNQKVSEATRKRTISEKITFEVNVPNMAYHSAEFINLPDNKIPLVLRSERLMPGNVAGALTKVISCVPAFVMCNHLSTALCIKPTALLSNQGIKQGTAFQIAPNAVETEIGCWPGKAIKFGFQFKAGLSDGFSYSGDILLDEVNAGTTHISLENGHKFRSSVFSVSIVPDRGVLAISVAEVPEIVTSQEIFYGNILAMSNVFQITRIAIYCFHTEKNYPKPPRDQASLRLWLTNHEAKVFPCLPGQAAHFAWPEPFKYSSRQAFFFVFEGGQRGLPEVIHCSTAIDLQATPASQQSNPVLVRIQLSDGNLIRFTNDLKGNHLYIKLHSEAGSIIKSPRNPMSPVSSKRSSLLRGVERWNLSPSSDIYPSTFVEKSQTPRSVYESFGSEIPSNLKISLTFSQIGISIISDIQREELFFTEISGVNLVAEKTGDVVKYDFKISNLQVDCQITESAVPVILANRGQMRRSESLSTVQKEKEGTPFVLIIAKQVTGTPQCIYLKYCDIQFDEVQLEIDAKILDAWQRWLIECSDILQVWKRSYLSYSDIKDWENPTSFADSYIDPSPANIIVLENFHIKGIHANVWCSFQLDDMQGFPEAIKLGLRILSASTKLELLGAQFRLEPIMWTSEAKSMKGTMGTFFNILGSQYNDQMLYGILINISNTSFFNIPRFGIDAIKQGGGAALVGFETLTSGFGSFLANLTFDPEYINRRQRERSDNNPSDFKEGTASSFKSLKEGFLSVGNIFSKPMEGAQKEGASGFMKGLGKGVMGTIIKPFDKMGQAVTNLSAGLRTDLTKPSGGAKFCTIRRRHPRMLWGESSRLTPYKNEEAQIRRLMGGKLLGGILRCVVTDQRESPTGTECAVLGIYPKRLVMHYLDSSDSMHCHDWMVEIGQIKSFKASCFGVAIYKADDSVLHIRCRRACVVRDVMKSLTIASGSVSVQFELTAKALTKHGLLWQASEGYEDELFFVNSVNS
eukprot:GHVP01039209.1.p1 GENE.GHVP01039209.1~~GHVP01039209.1.p1  ORF type:complete len:3857 (+),score=639.41 GHVP01039209.1:38-11608(+)